MAVLDLIPTLTGTEKLSEITPKETNEKFTPANPGFIFNFDLSFGKEQIEFSFFKIREKVRKKLFYIKLECHGYSDMKLDAIMRSLPKDESKESKKTVKVEIDKTNEDEEDGDRFATTAESTNQLNNSGPDDKGIIESSQSSISFSNHSSNFDWFWCHCQIFSRTEKRDENQYYESLTSYANQFQC
ncbi:hypothetical protein WICPIJ_003246 [Wickerhamomyces pijperi]|uniref:Uncharacterized protein n=1 Tax=Wickerhamomyces pijperi TaxID=599730 RepID=A0A9P8Q804_WICPI|nr:hypothetical protein WICPIJ_003246 [Wickerhamomyces pijperi]